MRTQMRGSAARRGYWFGKPGAGRDVQHLAPFFSWLDTWHLLGPTRRWVELEPSVDTALCVALKLLQRGELAPLLSDTEELLFGELKEHPVLKDFAIHPAPPAPWTAPFDSPREEKFWTWITEKLPSLSPYIVPQAPFEWLTDSPGFLGQRVDFLVWFPGHKGIVVEIDDPNKDLDSGTRQQKQLRDQECQRLGIRPFRISNNEIDSGFSQAPGCEDLLAFLRAQPWLKQNSNTSLDSGGHRTLWLPVLSARAQIALLESVGHGLLHVAAAKWVIEIVQDENWQVAEAAATGFVTLLGNLQRLYQCSILPRSIILHCRTGSRVKRLVYTSETREWRNAGKGPQETADFSLKLLSPGQRAEMLQPTSSAWIIGSAIPGTACPRLLRFPRLLERPRKSDGSTEVLPGFLREIFGFEQFREHQEDIIWRTLSGLDSVVLLPTASGKSLVYQLAGLLLPGSALVIAPLKSLMADQNRMLQARGVAIALAPHQIGTSIKNLLEETGFIFLAPERLRTVKFSLQIQAAMAGAQLPVCLVVLDETHCVSEWGHDFRVMYLEIGSVIRTKFGKDVAIPALTGTASHWVLTDVRREIGSRDAQSIIEARNMDRKELRFGVVPCASTELSKLEALGKTLKRLAVEFGFAGNVQNMLQPQGDETPSGVIFCRSKNECAKVMAFVRNKLGVASCEIFHGKLDESQRARIQESFLENRVALLISTKAFGMGVDKPNIRFIVHYNLPGSIESWYQEVGRAGRDGKSAICVALYSEPAPELADLLRPTVSVDEARERYRQWENHNPYAKWDEELAGLLFFHLDNFPGVDVEVADALQLWECLERKAQHTLTASVSEVFGAAKSQDPLEAAKEQEQKNQRFQKAIHRLVCIGLIVDFSIAGKLDYALQLNPHPHPTCPDCLREAVKAFVVRYDPGKADEVAGQVMGGATKSGTLKSALDVLVRYTYTVFEKRRRFAIAEEMNLFKAALQETDVVKRNEALHKSVRAYLEAGPIKDLLIKFVSGNGGRWSLGRFEKLIDHARTEDKVMWEHGIAWTQGEFPEHPALALLRGLVQQWKGESAHQSFLEGLKFLARRSGTHHLSADDHGALVGRVLEQVAGNGANLARPLLKHVETLFPRELVDQLIKRWGGVCDCGFTPARELRAWASLKLLDRILAESKSGLEALAGR